MAEYVFNEVVSAPIYSPSLWYRVRLASTININVAADLTSVAIDGVTPTAGQQILLVGQTTTTQNGVWTVISGAGLSFQPPAKMNGVIVYSTEGSTNANKAWVCTTLPPNDLTGVNSLTFVQTIGPGVDGNATINGVETFTNKTLTSATNTMAVSALATTGADVLLSGATPPTPGQVLRATSATTANWQASPSGAGETNTASNVGTVNSNTRQVFKQKVGTDLQFRGIVGDSTINVTESAGLITIATNPSGMNINNIDTINTPFVANIEHGGTGIANPAAQNFLYYNGSTLSTIAAPIGEVVTRDGIQTLTNKTFSSTATNVIGTKWMRSATGIVDTDPGTPYFRGAYLTATSPTTASWTTAGVYYSQAFTSTSVTNTTSTSSNSFINKINLSSISPRIPGIYMVYGWMRITSSASSSLVNVVDLVLTINNVDQAPSPYYERSVNSQSASGSYSGYGVFKAINLNSSNPLNVKLRFRGAVGATVIANQAFLFIYLVRST